MADEPGQTLEVKGRRVTCPVCGHDRFWTRDSLLNTRMVTFFGFDWANQSATNYVCNECGHILWFIHKG
jgi:DNA-directed RNA polymerase subunit RPC12/RpoP